DIKSNGSLWSQNPNNVINNNGRLIFNKNSYASICSTLVQNNNPNSLFYVDKTLSTGFFPYWLNNNVVSTCAPNWFGTYDNTNATCIQGGNTNLPTGTFLCASPTTVYENIDSDGPFEILYNIDNTGLMSFTSVGAVAPVAYRLNNSLVTSPITFNPGDVLIAYAANGCKTILNANNSSNFNCNPALKNTLGIILLNNPTANQLINQFGTSINGKEFYVDGNFSVDADISFGNCTFYFTPGALITIEPNQTLSMGICTLKAACNTMWSGMYANDPTAEINLDHCLLQDAIDGISLMNNAKCTSSHNTFTNNHENLQINLNTLAATCSVTNNTFNFIGSLLPPYATEKPAHGIHIINSTQVEIGDLGVAGSGNTFDNLCTGIAVDEYQYISGQGPTLQLYIPPDSKVQLNNNIFTNIVADATYTNSGDDIGCGIYAHRSDAFKSLRVNVLNTLPAVSNPNINFTECDKAIWLRNTSGTVDRQKIFTCGLGFLAMECEGKKLRVTENIIDNTYWAIIKIGDETVNGFTAIGNTITLPLGNEDQWINFPPMGIFSSYSSKVHVGKSSLINNTIQMPYGNTGLGITIAEGSVDQILNNQIHFSSPNADLNVTVPKMIGLYSNNSDAIMMIGNTVDNGGGGNYAHTNNTGIYLLDNKNSLLQCNTLNFTKYGIFAVGNNGSSQYDRTVGNFMNNSDANLMLWKLTQEGSMGQIGNKNPLAGPFYDANNIYFDQVDAFPLDPNALPAFYNKVFRVTDCLTSISFNDEIVTSLNTLDQSRSTSNAGSGLCEVTIYPAPSSAQTFTCPS
ncbi:MAG TPA: hypothetical protein PLP14_07435, partial [Chitinophagaceae bacterium]|nr:hypothetical protein [Chitinophagaceae bacterium]